MTELEQADALKVMTSVIARCERAQPKFVHGTSQHTATLADLPVAQDLLEPDSLQNLYRLDGPDNAAGY